MRFLDDPTIPLDNGSERAADGIVLGRKNHYGSKSRRSAEVAATFYSLVESAKLNELEPRFYLRVAPRGVPLFAWFTMLDYGAARRPIVKQIGFLFTMGHLRDPLVCFLQEESMRTRSS